jgi:hypothetical protein
MPGLSEARITSDGPLDAGSTLVYWGTFLGRRYDMHAECTGLTENKHFATRTVTGPFYLETERGAGTGRRGDTDRATPVNRSMRSWPGRPIAGYARPGAPAGPFGEPNPVSAPTFLPSGSA